MKRLTIIALMLFLLPGVFAQKKGPDYGLPAGARVVEIQSLAAGGHAERAIVLWMVSPKEYPSNVEPDEPYTCPVETRGSFYSGPTRVSLMDTKTNKIINTVKILLEDRDDNDSLDIPYAIRKGRYYEVEGQPDKSGESKARILALKDYNGDGKALEFALFDAIACMGLPTTLIGYSEAQDKVIQYTASIEVVHGEERATETINWVDYLFSQKPVSPGYWKYEIDYRGRGGSLDKYEIRYNAKAKRFEGKLTIQVDQ